MSERIATPPESAPTEVHFAPIEGGIAIVESTIELSGIVAGANSYIKLPWWPQQQFGETNVLVRFGLDSRLSAHVLVETGLNDDAECKMTNAEALRRAIGVLQSVLSTAEALEEAEFRERRRRSLKAVE
jgi:hypothetical protein